MISLLAQLPSDKPLPVFPTSLYVEDAKHILILDYGVKPLSSDTRVAEPARIWRLSIPPAPINLEEISRDSSFVKPWGMTKDIDGSLIIVDRGEAHDDFDWRIPENPHEFGVIINYTKSSIQLQRAMTEINEIVQLEKPAHTNFTLKK